MSFDAHGERISVRPCHSLADCAGCVDLERAIWGYAEGDLYPLRMFINVNRTGGIVLGAFNSAGKMIGFTACMHARRGRSPYYHSLALGILPEYQGRGVGKALKWEQRRRALRNGIGQIEWTFDPMRAKNAFFNLEKLGGVVREYLCDYYGDIQSRFQQQRPTDRLICHWDLRSTRVNRAARGLSPRRGESPAAAKVSFPLDFEALASENPGEAHALQMGLRKQLLARLRRGFHITGFVVDNPCCTYLLDKNGRDGGAQRRRTR